VDAQPTSAWLSPACVQAATLDGAMFVFGDQDYGTFGFGLGFLGGNPVDMWASVNGRNWRELPARPWNATGPQEIK
jgi:hypothetical protein